MQFQQFDDRFQLRVQSGERVREALKRLLRDHDIGYASVTGLGAVRWVRLSYWNAETKEYQTREIDEQLEMVSLIGNAAVKEGGHALHLHVSLGRSDLSLLGGHFNDALAHPTVELWVQRERQPVHRVEDEQTGLPLMDLPEEVGV